MNKQQTTVSRPAAPSRKLLLLFGILLIAANMRAAITALGPLAGWIREETGLSNAAMGWLTTIPLIVFAALSPLAPILARRWGTARMLLISLCLMSASLLLRAIDAGLWLFLGTTGVGIAIAVCNVLLPSVVKEHYPRQIGFITGLYSMTMSLFAAIASGVSIPLAADAGWGWRYALSSWAGLALFGLLLWLALTRMASQSATDLAVPLPTRGRVLWRSSLAWKITLFMGFQSLSFYIAVAWLPDLLVGKGRSPEQAGYMLSLMQLAGIPFNLLIPTLVERMKNQRLIIAFATSAGLLGYLLFFTEHMALLTVAAILAGIGQGASISLALMLFAMRSRDAREAAAMSGMAQFFGYALAALGPVAFGWLFDVTHSWTGGLGLLAFSGAFTVVFGVASGRRRMA